MDSFRSDCYLYKLTSFVRAREEGCGYRFYNTKGIVVYTCNPSHPQEKYSPLCTPIPRAVEQNQASNQPQHHLSTPPASLQHNPNHTASRHSDADPLRSTAQHTDSRANTLCTADLSSESSYRGFLYTHHGCEDTLALRGGIEGRDTRTGRGFEDGEWDLRMGMGWYAR